MTISAANVAAAVTLSAVSITYDTSGTEVELAAANYSYSNGVITLNLTSGSGRVTLDSVSDGVTISTTWSNGDVATDTSSCTVPIIPVLHSSDYQIRPDTDNDDNYEVSWDNTNFGQPDALTVNRLHAVSTVGSVDADVNLEWLTFEGTTELHILLDHGWFTETFTINRIIPIDFTWYWSNGETTTTHLLILPDALTFTKEVNTFVWDEDRYFKLTGLSVNDAIVGCRVKYQDNVEYYKERGSGSGKVEISYPTEDDSHPDMNLCIAMGDIIERNGDYTGVKIQLVLSYEAYVEVIMDQVEN